MITKEEAIKKYGDINPNQKNNFINWENVNNALQSDEWEPVFSEFSFDPKKLDKYFTYMKQSKTWYPKPETFKSIMEKAGIEGCLIDTGIPSIIEYVKSEIDINPILCKGLEENPTMRIIDVSVRVTKVSKIRNGDGTFSSSGPCSGEHPFFVKAVDEWMKEERWSEGYTKPGEYKFDNKYKRQKRLQELKMHALAIAETKALSATITVLAGLPKGFAVEDLSSGALGFVKFVRSKKYQTLYTMASLDAIRKGNTAQIEDMSTQLFGENKNEDIKTEPIIDQEKEDSKPSQIFSTVDKTPDKTTKIRNLIEKYYKKYLSEISKIPNAKETIERYIIDYKKISMKKLEEMLNKIENNIPGIEKIDYDNEYNIYEEDSIF